MNVLEVRVPDIGDFKDVAIIEVLAAPGDLIAVQQSLITVESDKASLEIPSSGAGVLKELKVKLGDTINVGDLVAILEGTLGVEATPKSTASPMPAAPPRTTATVAPIPTSAPPPASMAPAAASTHDWAPAPVGALAHASPSVRKLARDLGVPLHRVQPTGPKGRITQADVRNFVKAALAAPSHSEAGKSPLDLLPWPQVDFSKFGPIERRDLSRIKKISGANLHRNWMTIPHVTNHCDADITDVEAFRISINKENEKSGVKLTMLAFLVKACVFVLRKFPEFNSSLDGEKLVLKSYFHIGFAADTPQGLVVPVIRDVDKKGVLTISEEMAALASKARAGKLSPTDMQGACFTISSLGGIGGRYFTPIINAPEVAILGVCRASTEPAWDGKQFAPRLKLPLSLAWDHRVIDGAAAARFNACLTDILSDFRRVLI